MKLSQKIKSKAEKQKAVGHDSAAIVPYEMLNEWIEDAMSMEQTLRQPSVSGLLLADVRQSVADYMYSEGCSCCRSSNHDENGEQLAKMLKVKKYADKSGYDWFKYRSKQ